MRTGLTESDAKLLAVMGTIALEIVSQADGADPQIKMLALMLVLFFMVAARGSHEKEIDAC